MEYKQSKVSKNCIYIVMPPVSDLAYVQTDVCNLHMLKEIEINNYNKMFSKPE